MSGNNAPMDFSDKFALASPKKQTLYPISQRDWQRLKTMIQSIVAQTNWYQTICSASVGIFATSVFFLFGFESSKEVKGWVVILAWVILGVSLALAIVCFMFDRNIKQRNVFAKEQIIEEMKVVESSFENTEDSK